jgi:hypothetical protein
MDKKFFQLVFTPFFSCAMQGTDCHIPWERNNQLMIKRLKEMPDTIRAELLDGLRIELKATEAKIPRIAQDLQIDFQLKVEAIKKILQSF